MVMFEIPVVFLKCSNVLLGVCWWDVQKRDIMLVCGGNDV